MCGQTKRTRAVPVMTVKTLRLALHGLRGDMAVAIEFEAPDGYTLGGNVQEVYVYEDGVFLIRGKSYLCVSNVQSVAFGHGGSAHE